jgi:hypothetical protein
VISLDAATARHLAVEIVAGLVERDRLRVNAAALGGDYLDRPAMARLITELGKVAAALATALCEVEHLTIDEVLANITDRPPEPE